VRGRSANVQRHKPQQFVVAHLGQQRLAFLVEQAVGDGLLALDHGVNAPLDRERAT